MGNHNSLVSCTKGMPSVLRGLKPETQEMIMQETNNIYQVRNCAINSGPAERSPGLFGEN